MITVPDAETPWLSVVVVTWNSLSWLPRSLGALIQNTPDSTYELIVADNASTDGTATFLEEELTGTTVLRNDSNLGFGIACNLAALVSRGQILCFLNPDALVPLGWSDVARQTFEDPSVGIGGPMLQTPTGAVQEAGVVVSGEGHPMQFGYGDPSVWHAAKRRTTAVSGACMMVRKKVFEAVGGFDPIFHPAYNEDVDLCLSVRHELHMQVLYCAAIAVTHVAQTSVGAALADELKAHNTEILYRKWRSVLQQSASRDELAARTCAWWAARDTLTDERVLIVADEPHSGVMTECMQLASTHPAARITLLCDKAEEQIVWKAGAVGLELVCPSNLQTWLDARSAHYTIACCDPTHCSSKVRASIERTQPGIEWLSLAEIEGRLEQTV